MKRRKPTRRDLLVVIGRLQDAIGAASSAHGNDRNQDGFEQGQRALKDAHELCVEARRHDPPIEGRLGPWGAQ